MSVYLPFDDGSSVSFDGSNFRLFQKPVGLDDCGSVRSMAEDAWERNGPAVMRALESAWRKKRDSKRSENVKRVYGGN